MAAVDAMLTNPTAGDLTLVSGAAARHAGTPLPNFSDVPYPGSGPVLLYHYDVAPDLGYAELLAAGGDTTAPTFSDVAAGTPTSSGVTITWTTNEASDSQVEYGLTASYGSFSALLDTGTMVTSHSVPLSGLTPNTLYHYRVRSRDAAGNLGTDTTDRTFTTAVAADTTGPVISNVSGGVPTSNGTIVTWTTNEPADSQVEYGTTTAYGDSTPIDNGLVTSHSVPVSGLLPSTLYHYRVRSTDAVGNPSVSGDFTFTTAAVGVPVAPSGLTAVAVGQTQITLSWSDQSVDETGFEIEWSPNGSTGWTLLTAVGPNVQTYNDTGLAPGTTRFYRLRAYRVT